MRKVILIGWIVILLCVIFVAAAPPSPVTFWSWYNHSTYYGQPLPVGAVITAYDPDGILCGNNIVEYSGGYYVDCMGDNLDTPLVDEGAVEGETITFYINGYLATVTAGDPTFIEGTFSEVDISVYYEYDEDNDGVLDGLDQCASTPSDEAVNSEGCSCSQQPPCNDGNECTDDSCNPTTAECDYVNDDTNDCGFARDCTDSTCILKETPPYFFWRAYPEDGNDYCVSGQCMQYDCEVISEEYDESCSIADTSELEARVDVLEGQVSQLEQQNLDLNNELNILSSNISSINKAFKSFVALIDSFLFNLPRGIRQGMLCGALEQSGETVGEGFGLHCEIDEQGKCECSGI